MLPITRVSRRFAERGATEGTSIAARMFRGPDTKLKRYVLVTKPVWRLVVVDLDLPRAEAAPCIMVA